MDYESIKDGSVEGDWINYTFNDWSILHHEDAPVGLF